MGRTVSGRKAGNVVFGDDVLSPNVVSGMWADCPLLAYLFDPSIGHLYDNHFHAYATGDWTLTTIELGGGNATEAITDEVGGVLLVTNDAADNDSDEFQMKVCEAFKLTPNKPAWLEGRFKVSDATQSDFIFGLCITDTILFDGFTDGVYFLKDDGDANIDRHTEKNSTDDTADTGVDMADGVYVILGIKWDGVDGVEYWINGVQVATSKTNVPDDENLCISFGLMNGEAVAKTLSVDYIRAFQVL